MMDRLQSPGFVRALTWVSVLVLIAGIAAVGTVWLSGDGNSAASPAVGTAGGETVDQYGELPEETKPNVADVPAAARTAAAIFIDGAVARNNLAKAWTVIHPEFKEQCACTRAQWLTGDIPVQFYPALGADATGFGVNEISPGRIVLEVLLEPQEGHGRRSGGVLCRLEGGRQGREQEVARGLLRPDGKPAGSVRRVARGALLDRRVMAA